MAFYHHTEGNHMNKHSFKELELEVIRWAEARKIIPRSTPVAQSRKTCEESAELLEAAARLQLLEELKHDLPVDSYIKARTYILDQYRDAVGDVVVTLLNGCALADVDLVSCLAGSYDEIKDRKGTLMPDGIFVKE
jgi:NTP pyrophosphatase (non-canonical NTP hydrolase)